MIKKPLLVSLAAAALLTGNAQAASMYDRMTEMEAEMKALKAELEEVKSAKPASEGKTAMKDEPEDDEGEDADGEDDEGEDDEGESEADDQNAYIEEQLTELNKRTSGNHLKFGVDFRTSVDNLQYKMADGSTQENNALLTNRLWINMDWAATENMSFTGQLAYYKAYGQRSGFSGQIAGFETFDWITNENPYDDVVRVRSAYYFYRNDTFLGADVPWTFSIGRRPSTNGHLINMRDDDPSASPMGHSINVEFDGMSAKFTVWEDIGMYFKFCAGRGNTNAAPKFFGVVPTSYTNDNNETSLVNTPVPSGAPYATTDDYSNIDLAGLIFVPYNDGQYTINTQYYYADNLIDAKMVPYTTDGQPVAPDFSNYAGMDFQGMENVGGMHSFTANVVISGIGDEWSDFLDDTTVFVSGALSLTNPDSGKSMLGSTDSELGYSAWAGIQFPSLITESGRWGLEYNKGSQYWRSITYAEDTLAGSKIAARGDAYEAYFTEPLIDDVFSFQLRYTYIDYKFSGSNGFFGSSTGTPNLISGMSSSLNPMVAGNAQYTVDTAQDIRAYLRYRF